MPHLPHSRHTVLVVDDDPSILRMLSAVLGKAGFQVIEASRALQALELVERLAPCMVLADVMMPKMDGFEFCRRLKTNPRLARIPVALLTAKTQDEDVQTGIEVGASDYIKKPCNHAELQMRIRTQILLHEALLEQERLNQHLTAIGAASLDAIVVANAEAQITHWNDAAERMFAYSRDAALGRRLDELLAPERHREAFRAAFAEPRGREPDAARGSTVELVAQSRCGREFPVQVSVSAAAIDDQWSTVWIVRDVSRQYATQEALRRSEAEHRQLFEGSRDALATLTPPTWRFASCNQSFLRLFGAESKAQVCDRDPAALSPDLQPGGEPSSRRAAELVARALEDGSAAFNWVHRRRDGSDFLCDVLLARIGAGDSAILQATLRDITEPARQAAELRASEARYRTSFEDASVGQALLSRSGTVLESNATLASMLRVGVHELAGRTLDHWVHPGDAEQFGRIRSELLAGANARRTELRCINGQGSTLWLDLNIAAIRFTGEEMRHLVLHATDITERRLAEEQAAASREFMESLLAALPVPVFYKDCKGRYRGANRALEAFFGKKASEILGHTAFALYPPDVAAEQHHDDLELLTSNGIHIQDRIVANSEGATREVVYHKAVFTDRTGAPQGLIGVIMDVTDRKRAEEELEHARKLEAVGQLAAGIAHEINTPAQYVGDGVYFLRDAFGALLPLIGLYRQMGARLAHLQEHAELVERVRTMEEEIGVEFIEANLPGCFERCIDGISRISTIVKAMKEFSHPDQREKTPGDINQALQTTLIIAHNEYKYVADVETRLGELPLLPCYIGDLNQVFLNLIVNAAHAIGDVVQKDGGRGKITLETSQEADVIRIDISDTGTGIPEAIRDRLFEPFFTTKEVGKGTGQGLPIARSIVVDKHGGTLTFKSEVGVGTTFTIRLPLGAQQAAEEGGVE